MYTGAFFLFVSFFSFFSFLQLDVSMFTRTIRREGQSVRQDELRVLNSDAYEASPDKNMSDRFILRLVCVCLSLFIHVSLCLCVFVCACVFVLLSVELRVFAFTYFYVNFINYLIFFTVYFSH